MKYTLTAEDFDKVFSFALDYHLDPKKSHASRTSGATRGLGGVMDSFMAGKLVELGVSNALKSLVDNKEFALDFDIKKNNEVLKEPDIVKVLESGAERDPKCFVEIKNISKDDRWSGLTLEQFDTIKKSNTLEDIYIIGAYIQNNNLGNDKQKDLLGIYLKNKFNLPGFGEFTDIKNIEVVIDYAISGVELEAYSMEFKKGDFLYETEIFEIAGKRTNVDIQNGKIRSIGILSDDYLELYKMNNNYPAPIFMGEVEFKGTIELYEKLNSGSTKRFVRCVTDTVVTNDIVGEFKLEKDKIYLFNLSTIGRNPALNRNNIWIAKRNILHLQNKKMLLPTEKNLYEIANKI